MATPLVSGTAALVQASCGSSLPAQAVWDHIANTADPIAGTGTLFQNGRLNALKAVCYPPPANLHVGAVGMNSLQLLWIDTTPGESFFEIQSEIIGSNNWTTAALAAPNTSTFTHTGLSAGTSYDHRVRACDSNGCSGFSNVATASAGFMRLTVSVGGAGKVTSSPAGINCGATFTTCSILLPPGSLVYLTPTPSGNIGKGILNVFDHWEGACAVAGYTCSLTLNTNLTTKAVFVRDTPSGLACSNGQLLMSTLSTDAGEAWPALPYADWKPTLTTLHMWLQIIGKVKLALAPFLNDWWNVAFALTARGLTTSTIPFGSHSFEVTLDFIDHRLVLHVSDGRSIRMPLVARSVADFYQEFMANLESLGMHVTISPHPVEVDDGIPFAEDREHATYDAMYVTRWWRILLGVNRVLERYRTPFVGKSSPVQFWWGSFDLATSRYSGRPAPARDWPARWMARAAQQEHALAGFWPGNARLPEPAFVAYTYPEPPGCRVATIQADAAYFHPELAEFILPYDKVRQAADPDQVILDFYRSTYEIGATLAGWDRAALESRGS